MDLHYRGKLVPPGSSPATSEVLPLLWHAISYLCAFRREQSMVLVTTYADSVSMAQSQPASIVVDFVLEWFVGMHQFGLLQCSGERVFSLWMSIQSTCRRSDYLGSQSSRCVCSLSLCASKACSRRPPQRTHASIFIPSSMH